ncbi:hypothetical protein F5Y19DRAFT_398828 [Xylariaceae sp. FL1651]|nr:hypothetical protein F5Y19DRAFT_398828 [Xylariaceae sp. FL1651]
MNQSNATTTVKERRKSFGIGGAGNIRTRDEALVHDAFDLVERQQRRKSSLWSTSTDSTSNDNAERKSSTISETLKNVFSSSARRSKSIGST